MSLQKPQPHQDADDDNDEIVPEEIAAASDETPIEDLTAPELNAETEGLVEWDTPPEATGHATPKVALEDETSAAEQLVEEGTDEAERDRRIAAADPDFEP